jgi:hypothetical protein
MQQLIFVDALIFPEYNAWYCIRWLFMLAHYQHHQPQDLNIHIHKVQGMEVNMEVFWAPCRSGFVPGGLQ